MKPGMNCRFVLLRGPWVVATFLLLCLTGVQVPCRAQLVVGAINGTVLDSSGAAVGDAEVKAHNVGTGLELKVHSNPAGSYSIPNLPVGTYVVTFTKQGFETETHIHVLVTSDRATTVNGSLKVGTVSTTVEVTSTPLMNQTDATNGYVVDRATIEDTPLGTGSFTQLAILAPGVHADFLQGAGSNAGLGNQEIFANGNRSTSNNFSLNGVSTNNLFNGNSSSSVGENRFVLNTGENFGAANTIQTSTSVYGAIGQALPTPPADAIEEITVNAAMYDATQGNNSGAHIGVLTKSGTNAIHGSAWEQWQNSDMNAAPYFYNASPAITTKVPYSNRNQFGATFGGPIKKDKAFYFLSYQGIRVSDAAQSIQDDTVPLGLTNDRSAGGIYAALNATYNPKTPYSSSNLTINPVAMNLLNAKLPNGQYLIPSPQITNVATAETVGYDAVVQGPNSLAPVDQGIADVNLQLTGSDRLSAKFYIQDNPTSNPFGAVSYLLGFPQTLSAGSDVATISNNIILSPTLTWEQHIGFSRLRAYSNTADGFTPSAEGMSLLGDTNFPYMEIRTMDPTLGHSLYFGPSLSFGNGGMYQDQWEFETSMNKVLGKHTLSMGIQWDRTQLNVLNQEADSAEITSNTFLTFVQGTTRASTYAFVGNASRYYRANTAGAYISDNFKVRPNLTITAGLRWDDDGPFAEKYGRMTAFNPAIYAYNASTDTITNGGIEIAGNNSTGGTSGVSNSTMIQNQWGFAPRIGIAWSPYSKLTVRAGYGIYYDRGELFSYFSPGAGAGFNGPFGVTLAPPFVQPVVGLNTAGDLAAPFGTTVPSAPPGNAAGITAYLPNIGDTIGASTKYWPAGNYFGPFVYGGYDIANKLPYTENWTLDLQYQVSNNWLFEVAYVGNHGQHEVLPVAFNEPTIASPSSPLWAGGPHEQMYSYGGVTCTESNTGPTGTVFPCQNPHCCTLEPVSVEFSGNAPVRVPYPGLDMNSVLYEAEGVSNYSALEIQAHKRASKGLELTAAYTYSHTLDEQSALGLFVTGNNPIIPQQNYASADFDQTHVLLINYNYTLPSALKSSRGWGYLTNGWILGGQFVAESGQPYSVYDFYGSVGSLNFGTDIEISNPIVPLAPNVKAKQALLQGTLGVKAGLSNPVYNINDFAPQFVAPGTDGVPPCDSSGCDIYESPFGTTGRNMFRGPFQSRFDMSLSKAFAPIRDRYQFRFEFDAFNVFNHPDFDTPNNAVEFLPGGDAPPVYPPIGYGGSPAVITHTTGSSRFLMLGLHLLF